MQPNAWPAFARYTLYIWFVVSPTCSVVGNGVPMLPMSPSQLGTKIVCSGSVSSEITSRQKCTEDSLRRRQGHASKHVLVKGRAKSLLIELYETWRRNECAGEVQWNFNILIYWSNFSVILQSNSQRWSFRSLVECFSVFQNILFLRGITVSCIDLLLWMR